MGDIATDVSENASFWAITVPAVGSHVAQKSSGTGVAQKPCSALMGVDRSVRCERAGWFRAASRSALFSRWALSPSSRSCADPVGEVGRDGWWDDVLRALNH
jgi:hypothetical protein